MSGLSETILERAKRCFKQACEAEAKQREREREDLKFQVPEEQWDAEARAARRGGATGGVAVPGRPILSISKLDQPIQLVLNQARQARLGVNIHPISEEANTEGADIRQGLYRRIERDSNADQARLWALDRATKAGRGFYRINKKYDEDADPKTFDQEIVIERILHQDTVYLDPTATKADFSDGEWAIVTAMVSLEKFEKDYPKAKVPADDGEFQGLSQEDAAWFNVDGEKRGIRVAEYWYKVHDVQTITVETDDGPREREHDRVSVKRCTVTGLEELESIDWDGKYIPIVVVPGRELQPFDGERRWTGMIGPSKDGQRLYNFAASTLVERMAMEPKTPFIGYAGQFATDKAKWDHINTKNFPYVESDVVNVGGQPVPLPQRAQLDQTGMSLAMMALQEADNFIQSTTSVYDPSLGKATNQQESGKKILALQQQSDAGTSHYLAALADISMPYEARVVLDLMPKVYDRPGRVTTILRGDDDKSEPIMLNAPFTMDQNSGRPMPAQQQPGMPAPKGVKEYDLSKGAYSVSVDIGKSFQTRLQQGGEFLGQVMGVMPPEILPAFADLAFRYRDEPGAKEMADRLAKVREKYFPGIGEGEGDNLTPEQMKLKLQAIGQENQALKQKLGEASKIIETDQAKQQAQLQKATMDNQTRLEVAKLDHQEAAAGDALTMAVEKLQQQFEAQQKERDRQHELFLKKLEMAHDVAMAAGGSRSMETTRDRGQEQERGREDERSQGQSRGTESSSESGYDQPQEGA